MNITNFISTLPIMAMGMGGIIFITLIMIGCIVLLNKVFGEKPE